MLKLAFVSISALGLLTVPATLAYAQQGPGETPSASQTGRAPGTPIPGQPPAAAADPTADSASTDSASNEKKKEQKPLWFRGTTFTMDTYATSTAIGIGRDNIGGEDEEAGFLWIFTPNAYVLDLPKDKINVSATLWWLIDVTNADTTTNREVLFRDTPIKATYTRSLYDSSDKEWSTKGKISAGVILPTSPLSYHEGKYLTTTLGASVSQIFKLLGTKADGLNNLTLTGSVGWNHLFSRTYTPPMRPWIASARMRKATRTSATSSPTPASTPTRSSPRWVSSSRSTRTSRWTPATA